MPPNAGPVVLPLEPTEYQLSFIDELQAAKSEYLVVGAVAMWAHGYLRTTHDIDVLINPTLANATTLLPILCRRFRNRPPELTEEWLCSPNKRLPLPSHTETEIDILTSIGALDFQRAFAVKHNWELRGRLLPIVGLSELIYTKLVSYQRNESPNAIDRDAQDIAELIALGL